MESTKKRGETTAYIILKAAANTSENLFTNMTTGLKKNQQNKIQ